MTLSANTSLSNLVGAKVGVRRGERLVNGFVWDLFVR